MRSTLILAVIVQLLVPSASAQDRPLYEPIRIGYPASGSFGQRLQADDALVHNLRRMGLIVSWHSFGDGLAALRALHAEEIDVALDIASHEVVLAQLEILTMVFVAERKTCDDDCDSEADFIDSIGRRYTLTSEYFADRRENALMAIFRALRGAARSEAQSRAPPTRHPTTSAHHRRTDVIYDVGFVARSSLTANQRLIDELLAAGRITRQFDPADVNYWKPICDVLGEAFSAHGGAMSCT